MDRYKTYLRKPHNKIELIFLFLFLGDFRFDDIFIKRILSVAFV